MSNQVFRLALVGALCIFGCQTPPTVDGSGREAEKKIDLERPITAVLLGGPLDADLLQLSTGGVQEAILSAEENILGYLQISQEEGHLSIKVQPGIHLRPTQPVRLVASLPFDTVSLEDSATARLRLSGRFLKLELEDAARAEAIGRLGLIEVDAEDASQFDFSACPARDASFKLSDSSRGVIEVRSRIRTVELDDASQLRVLGAPRVDRKIVRDASLLHIEQGDGTSSP